MKVPFARPDITDAEKRAVADVLDSGWLTSGPVTARLEDMAKEITGARNVVAVNSCATALWMAALYARDDFDGRNVWPGASIPAIGGHFAANAAMLARLELASMDCNDDLSCTRRTGPVQFLLDYGGGAFPFGVDDPSHGKPLEDFHSIIDAAYTLGAPGDAKPRGWVRCYSLQATKSITSGEGGLLATEDDDFAAWCRQVRSHGMQASSYERGEGDYEVVVPGGGFLLPDVCSAIAVSQLSRCARMHARRVQIGMAYDAALAPAVLAGRVIPVPRDYERDGLGLYALRIPEYAERAMHRSCRFWFRHDMLECGVSTRNHYRAIWENPCYEFLREQWERDCPNAARVSKEVVTLPLFSAMTDEECAAVCAALKEVLGG